VIRVAIRGGTAEARAGLAALLGSDRLLVLPDGAETEPGAEPGVLVILADGVSAPSLPGAGGPAVVVILDRHDRSVTTRLLRAGARSVLPREASDEQIQAAVAAAAAGLVAVPAERGTPAVAARRAAGPAAQPLTPREAQVLNLIAAGLGNKLIARRLAISEHTVKSHVESVFGKLGVGTRAEAVTRGVQLGIVYV
jgi:DNA-binding NarL/FixJ family response regulator